MRSYGKTLSLLMSVCFLFLAATATVAFAQDAGTTTGKCSFQKLSFPPPATNANPVALNDLGGIAGDFFDSKNVRHGFLFYQGRLTTFRFPGSSGTSVTDMSRNGIIVGDFSVAGDPRTHHYMVHAGGFHEITLPGHPNADFTVTGVNSNGDIVGTINSDTLPVNGYVLHNGKLTLLLVPGSDITLPTSINDQGVVVGGSLAELVNENPAFMWKNGVFSNIVPPGSFGFVNAFKVSNSGVVVGFFQSANTNNNEGFALDNGTYTNIDSPSGFSDIVIFAVNKFDNILVQATQRTQQGDNTVLFKGFCAAAF
ncbi:MAG TPA: hypothetical protein VFP71_11585 [Candidatus Angelobacter sp.]|nr:hypothetical protein [Candidatus Angelobacter sp.]